MESVFSIMWYISRAKGSGITNLVSALFSLSYAQVQHMNLWLHINLVRTCTYTYLYSHSYRMSRITGTEWNFNVVHIFLNDFNLCNAHFNYLMYPNTFLRVNLIIVLVLKGEQDWQNTLKTNFLWLLCDVIIQTSSLALKHMEINTSEC